jgi:hypothetical protein
MWVWIPVKMWVWIAARHLNVDALKPVDVDTAAYTVRMYTVGVYNCLTSQGE